MARAGGEAAAAVCVDVLPSLVGEGSGIQHRPAESRCLAWGVAHAVVAAWAGEGSASGQTPAAAGALRQVVASAAAGDWDAAAPASTEAAVPWDEDPSAYTPERQAWLQLATLAAALAPPAFVGALQGAEVEAAAASLLRCITGPAGSAEGQASALAEQATLGLCCLGRSGPGAPAVQSAVPTLVEAAMRPAADGGRSASPASLAALQQLGRGEGGAPSPSPLQAEVAAALDQAIQAGIPAAAAPPRQGSGLLVDLLRTAAELAAPDAASAGPRGEDGAGALLLPLAEHLLDAVQLLPSDAGVEGAVLGACADAAFLAARAGGAPAQQRLTASALSALEAAHASLASGGPAVAELESRASLQAAVASAVLVSLQPAALAGLPADRQAAAVGLLVDLAFRLPSAQAAHHASLAAASILNKWQGGACGAKGLCCCGSPL